MSCQSYQHAIQEYIDDVLDDQGLIRLQEHLATCVNCRQELGSFQKTMLLVKGQSQLKAPSDFVSTVMDRLPKENRWELLKKWMKAHPTLVAAALFLILMTSSFMTMWTDGQNNFYVSAPNMDQLQVDHTKGTVIVPDGEVIHGDLIVRNGNVEVRGEVIGDVIVTDGRIYLASSAHIVGQVQEIDQFLNWAWYHTQKWLKEAIQLKE
jgi:anti-sigma factor RsiW